jgi:coenzyme F420-reducing hydrogenase delta subunit
MNVIGGFSLLQKMLGKSEIEDRVRLKWFSASNGEGYAPTVQYIIEMLRTLGPVSRNRSRES